MLYPGDRNKSTKALKQLLYQRDSLIMVNDENEINNHFDPLTQIAIIRFQHQQNLTGDGIVGPLTWRALRCTTRIMRLDKRLNAYRSAVHPCQKAALIWLQNQLSDAVLLGAERIIAAERGTEKIAVEIKSFTRPSDMKDLEEALGQCVLYSRLFARYDPDRKVYLAVTDEVYESVFEEEAGQILSSKMGYSV